MNKQFYIIGAGVSSVECLTNQAVHHIKSADVVFSTSRLAQNLSDIRNDIKICTIPQLAQFAIESEASSVSILVSGDVGFFSAASGLQRKLEEFGDTTLICGLSSMQYFCAKIGTSYDNAVIRTLHGRQGSLIGTVSYNKKVFTLTGGTYKAHDICRELNSVGLGGVCVTIGENLGSTDEEIITGTASMLEYQEFSDLCVMLIENDEAVCAQSPIFDKMLTRDKVPMTKEEIRWVSVAKMQIKNTDVVWDIGAGTGSVSIELARKACDGMVYAVERKPEAVSLLCQNRYKLGAFNINVVEGLAPEALQDLPTPDAVFIGGSAGQMKNLLNLCKNLNENVKIVVNAIALETLSETMDAMRELEFVNLEVVQIASSRGKEVGKYTMMTANNPVYIISAGGTYEG